MARYEHRGKRDFKDRGPNKDRAKRKNKDFKRDFEFTKVTCSGCGSDCEVPFKPTSNKPVFCSDCFSKKEKGSDRRSDRSSDRGAKSYSNRDLDVINEKLNKIMKALKIE